MSLEQQVKKDFLDMLIAKGYENEQIKNFSSKELDNQLEDYITFMKDAFENNEKQCGLLELNKETMEVIKDSINVITIDNLYLD